MTNTTKAIVASLGLALVNAGFTLRGSTLHKPRAHTNADNFAALIDAVMFKLNNARVFARFA
jgi:hypothetical protein